VAARTLSIRAVEARALADPVLVLPAAVALGLFAAWGALSAGATEARVGFDLAVAWSFAGAGVIALSRPAFRRVGVLMVVMSGVWFLSYLQLDASKLAWTVGWLLGPVCLALVAQLVLSYPAGRVWSAPARVVVGAAYMATVGVQLLSAFFQADGRNLLFVAADQNLAGIVGRWGSAFGTVVTIALAVLVVDRLIRLRAVARRVALPLLAGAVVYASVLAARLGASASGHTGLSDWPQPVDQLGTLLIPWGFFAGLLWTRLRRTGASTLVVELREGGAETLRQRLARALGDPTLEIAYWLEGTSGYVDEAGRPFELPHAAGRAVTQVLAGGAPVAVLVHDPILLDEPDLIAAVRATAGLVLENERLAAEVRVQLVEVRASRVRIVVAADEARRRLERDLHDGAQQRLVGLSLKLRLAQTGADPATAAVLEKAQDEVEQALGELREFARGVHPSVLREDGLDAAVEVLARRAPLPVEVRGSVGMRLPEAVELAAYFFISEALTNIGKHARASYATLELSHRDRLLVIAVVDDGIGGADYRKGSGLAGLADRLAALDGTVSMERPAQHGTRLVASIPCGS
jgi:signal transduction histidine kinase